MSILKREFFGKEKAGIFAFNKKLAEKAIEPKELENNERYYKAALRAFQQDKYKSQARMQKLLIGFASISLIAVATLCIALIKLLPLKEVKPYIVSIDQVTGRSEVTSDISALGNSSSQELIDASNISSWIIARESYSWHSLQSDLDYVELHSKEPIFRAMKNIMVNKEASPLKLLGEDKIVKVMLLSKPIISEDRKTATARFVKSVLDSSGNILPQYKTRYFIATITYDYDFQFENEKQRLANPLGFEVTSYRVDEEEQR